MSIVSLPAGRGEMVGISRVMLMAKISLVGAYPRLVNFPEVPLAPTYVMTEGEVDVFNILLALFEPVSSKKASERLVLATHKIPSGALGMCWVRGRLAGPEKVS